MCLFLFTFMKNLKYTSCFYLYFIFPKIFHVDKYILKTWTVIFYFIYWICVCVVLWITYAVDLDLDSVVMKSVPYHSTEDFRFSS